MDPKRGARPQNTVPFPKGPAKVSPLLQPSRPAPAPAAPRRGIQEAIDQVEREIQQLRVDFERFFNGALPFPPEELKGRIQTQLKQLRNGNIAAAADNFRLSEVEARFNSYSELFNRRLREAEEGGRQAPRAAAPEAPRLDPRRGIVVGAAVATGAAEALYQGLCSGPEAPRFDLDSFQSYLERQAASIRAKTGCSQVQFRLVDEDGKVKLKAKPVGA
jgi:hypothetical protein